MNLISEQLMKKIINYLLNDFNFN